MSTLGDPKISGSGPRSNGWESIGKAFGSIREAIAKILAGHQERGKAPRLAPPPSPSYGSPARAVNTSSGGAAVQGGTSTEKKGGGGMNVTTVSPRQTQAYEALKKKYGEERLQKMGYNGPQDLSDEEARRVLLDQVTSPAPSAVAPPKPAAASTPAAAPTATPAAAPSPPATPPSTASSGSVLDDPAVRSIL